LPSKPTFRNVTIVGVQRAFRTRYQSPLGTENPFCCGLSSSGEREVCLKKEEDTDRSNSREHRGCQTVRFAVSQALCTQTCVRPWHLRSFVRPIPHQDLVWFQQDGATANAARKSMADLREIFPGRLISLRDISWPARPPQI
jgi:hypothetical protein